MGWLQDIGNAISDAADGVATAVTNAADTVADAVGGAIETGGNAIASAIGAVGNTISAVPAIAPILGGILNLLGRFVAGATQVVAIGIRATVNTSAHLLGGVVRIVGGGIGGPLAGDGRIFFKGVLEIVAGLVGFAVATIGPAIGMVQSIFFLQPRERPLSETERTMLWRVYRDSLAYGNIRIVEGRAGLFSLSARPFTMGNWIYAKGADFSTEPATLVHECGHVWQNQHEGTIYLGNAVYAQATLGERAYYWWLELAAGKAWQDFNKEAQAAFIDNVFKDGSGGSATGLGSFYEDDPLGPGVHYEHDGVDRTAFARVSIAHVRAA